VNFLASRKDVAKLAGVSESTVSRVFNNVGPLREETKRKVLQAAEELNYHPNAIAQSLSFIGVMKDSSYEICLFAPHIGTRYFTRMPSLY
jgi:LacI family transcriptional regulator